MASDYPAAHSMDTEWFAVDKCGHVAVFHSGEEGAVPEGAPFVYDFLSASWPFPGELDRAFRSGELRPGMHGTKIDPRDGFFLLCKGLRTEIDIAQRPDHRKPHLFWMGTPALGTTDGRDWILGQPAKEAWAWLHEVPHRCLGCAEHLRIDTEKRMDAFRIFRFGCDNYGTPPYERENNPYPPATLAEVCALTGQPVPNTVRFPQFCFRDKLKLQPMQWLPSRSWGSDEDWIDEEGNQRGEQVPRPE